jgi:hypothetical protein
VLCNVLAHVDGALQNYLRKYSDEIGVILLAFENVTILSHDSDDAATAIGVGAIYNELPHIHYRVSADALRPTADRYKGAAHHGSFLLSRGSKFWLHLENMRYCFITENLGAVKSAISKSCNSIEEPDTARGQSDTVLVAYNIAAVPRPCHVCRKQLAAWACKNNAFSMYQCLPCALSGPGCIVSGMREPVINVLLSMLRIYYVAVYTMRALRSRPHCLWHA